jgi:hypothetical protein
VLSADILTPASSFLGVPVTTLQSDLAGGKTLAQEATAKSKSAADLIKAIVAAQKTVLDGDKAAGWITADQETSILDRFTGAVTDLVNNGPPVPPAGGKRVGLLDTASTFLGIPIDTLRADLKAGKTLADEASAKGKTVADLVTALEAPAKMNLDQAVTDRKLTQAQETAILTRMTDALTNLVNHTKPASDTYNSVRNSVRHYALLKSFSTRH